MRATNESLQRLEKGLDRALGALSLLAANQFEECLNLVWVTPIISVDSSRDPRNWIRNGVLMKYQVVFICAHSGEPGHKPFEITVPRGWIVKVAPWLKLCLLALKGIVNSYGLPFPIPSIPFLQQHEMLKTCLNSLIEEGTNAVLSQCETLLESGAMTIGTSWSNADSSGRCVQADCRKCEASIAVEEIDGACSQSEWNTNVGET